VSKLTRVRLLIVLGGIACFAAIIWFQERRDEPLERQQQQYEKLKHGFDQLVEVVPGATAGIVGADGTASTADKSQQVRKIKRTSLGPSELRAIFGKPDRSDVAYVWEAESPYSRDIAGISAEFRTVNGAFQLFHISHWVGNQTEQCGLTAAEWHLKVN
jgi:hypothetical protein